MKIKSKEKIKMPINSSLLNAFNATKDKSAVYNAPLPPYSPNVSGLVKVGNIDLTKQPSVYNPETKGQSTVWSMSVGVPEGEMLITRVTPDGKILSPKEAFNYAKKTGKHLGIFKTSEDADNYAKKMHISYERGFLSKPKLKVNKK